VKPGQRKIAAGGFLLVWADDETGQNGPGVDLHVNFKLNKGGASIGLYAPDGTLLDAVSFGAQATDTSEGRWPDGRPDIYRMLRPTPAAANAVFQARSVDALDAGFTLSWYSTPGHVYRVDYSGDLRVTNNWAPGPLVTAATYASSLLDTNAAGLLQRFYRIWELPLR
jgi:hypothetical protein